MPFDLDSIEDAEIDSGRFKYILIKLQTGEEGKDDTKFVVRGFRWAMYHGDIYDRISPRIEKLGPTCECVGGGRIFRDDDKKTIEIYGYSQGYGLADHAESARILEKKYPDYKVTWTNEGY